MPKIIECYFEPQANYGDMLSLVILQHFVSKQDPDAQVKYTNDPSQAHIIGIGSIMNAVPENYHNYIWSTGNAQPNFFRTIPSAKCAALRGLETVRCLNRNQQTDQIVLGDGGLLLPDLYNPPFDWLEQEYDIGLIPHVIDQKMNGASFMSELKKLGSSGSSSVHSCCANGLVQNLRVILIDLSQAVHKVTQQIRSCKSIISSSLHGLIIADAFQIPNARMIVTDQIIGGSHKFADYYSCFGLSIPPALTIKPETTVAQINQFIQGHHVPKPNLKQVQDKLRVATETMIAHLLSVVSDSPALPRNKPQQKSCPDPNFNTSSHQQASQPLQASKLPKPQVVLTPKNIKITALARPQTKLVVKPMVKRVVKVIKRKKLLPTISVKRVSIATTGSSRIRRLIRKK